MSLNKITTIFLSIVFGCCLSLFGGFERFVFLPMLPRLFNNFEIQCDRALGREFVFSDESEQHSFGTMDRRRFLDDEDYLGMRELPFSDEPVEVFGFVGSDYTEGSFDCCGESEPSESTESDTDDDSTYGVSLEGARVKILTGPYEGLVGVVDSAGAPEYIALTGNACIRLDGRVYVECNFENLSFLV